MRRSLNIKKTTLAELYVQFKSAREHFVNMKVRKNCLHRAMQQIQRDGGILTKPALLINYDETLETIAILEKENGMKRQRHDALTREILYLESILANHDA